jgi:hypothetical protein
VFVTYTVEGGLRKLKRIRFSRTVFSKDSAAKVGAGALEQGYMQPRPLGAGKQKPRRQGAARSAGSARLLCSQHVYSWVLSL